MNPTYTKRILTAALLLFLASAACLAAGNPASTSNFPTSAYPAGRDAHPSS